LYSAQSAVPAETLCRKSWPKMDAVCYM